MKNIRTFDQFSILEAKKKEEIKKDKVKKDLTKKKRKPRYEWGGSPLPKPWSNNER